MRALRYVTVLFTALALLAPPVGACTTLCLRHDGRIVFGKNYDWNVPDGLLLVNKRGVERSSDTRRPLTWVSKYGSVTFNQYGRDNPSGGINEAGLTIELMWVDGAQYPPVDARPAAGVLTWIQYQLDTSATVADVIASDAALRVQPTSVPLHFLVADKQGDVATIEFLGGKLVAHTGATLPAAALANDFYADSIAHLKKLDDAKQPVTRNASSNNRFAHAARRAREYTAKHGDPVLYVFETLTQVAQGEHTQWSIVYEIDRGRVHFRTRLNQQVKSLTLASLDFSCGSPVLALDLNQNQPGDVRAQLKPYTRDANLALLRSSYAQTQFLASVPAVQIEREASLPDATACRAASTAGASK